MSWLDRLKKGLKKSSDKISDGISGLFSGKPEEEEKGVPEAEISESNAPVPKEAEALADDSGRDIKHQPVGQDEEPSVEEAVAAVLEQEPKVEEPKAPEEEAAEEIEIEVEEEQEVKSSEETKVVESKLPEAEEESELEAVEAETETTPAVEEVSHDTLHQPEEEALSEETRTEAEEIEALEILEKEVTVEVEPAEEEKETPEEESTPVAQEELTTADEVEHRDTKHQEAEGGFKEQVQEVQEETVEPAEVEEASEELLEEKPQEPESPEEAEETPTEAPVSTGGIVDTTEEPTKKKGFFARAAEAVSAVFTKRKLDQDTLDQLEEILIQSDMGVTTSMKLCEALGKKRLGKDVTEQEVKEILADEIEGYLSPVAQPITLSGDKPHVILMVGVNGSGKTTTIAKLASFWCKEGKKLSLVAGDTFRAAAVEQLKVWGDRLNVPVVSGEIGADAAGLIFDAYKASKERGDDILLVDTAGRLHNNANLMAELEKINRVIKKVDDKAPHHCLLVLDATVGQNAHNQVETFQKMVGVDGLICTKLDGSAKGGVLVALAEKFKLPIHAIGVGESAEDLKSFEAKEFARSLMGL